MLEGVRRAIHEVDPTVPVAVDRSMATISFTMLLLATAGIVALAVAVGGALRLSPVEALRVE